MELSDKYNSNNQIAFFVIYKFLKLPQLRQLLLRNHLNFYHFLKKVLLHHI